jgi:hypothetical protein
MSSDDMLERWIDPDAPLPKRTGQTELSDDELLLFDFLFDTWVPFGALVRDAYIVHMNVRYSHRLEDNALRETLERLIASKLVTTWTIKRPQHRSINYSLTAKGGRLWEKERQPDWNRFCTSTHLESELVVTSPSLQTAETFVRAWHECGLDTCDLSQMHHEHRSSEKLVPWKSFTDIYEVHVPYVRDELGGDWACYEGKRQWWRSITELDTLRRSP